MPTTQTNQKTRQDFRVEELEASHHTRNRTRTQESSKNPSKIPEIKVPASSESCTSKNPIPETTKGSKSMPSRTTIRQKKQKRTHLGDGCISRFMMTDSPATRHSVPAQRQRNWGRGGDEWEWERVKRRRKWRLLSSFVCCRRRCELVKGWKDWK